MAVEDRERAIKQRMEIDSENGAGADQTKIEGTTKQGEHTKKGKKKKRERGRRSEIGEEEARAKKKSNEVDSEQKKERRTY